MSLPNRKRNHTLIISDASSSSSSGDEDPLFVPNEPEKQQKQKRGRSAKTRNTQIISPQVQDLTNAAQTQARVSASNSAVTTMPRNTAVPMNSYPPPRYIDSDEDIALQRTMHQQITTRYFISFSVPKCKLDLIVRSIMITSGMKARELTIGFEGKAKSFTVFPELLKLHSLFFRSYVFQAPAVNAIASVVPIPDPGLAQPQAVAVNENEATALPHSSEQMQDNPSDSIVIKIEPGTIPAPPPIAEPPISPPHQAQAELGSHSRPIDAEVELPLLATLHPLEFAIFLSFIYTGIVTEKSISLTASTQNLRSPPLESLWFLGSKLRAAGFQNRVMELLLTSSSMQAGLWPSAAVVRYIEHMRDPNEECKLFDLAVICVAIMEPMKKYEEGSAEAMTWEKILEEKSEVLNKSLRTSTESWKKKPYNRRHLGKWLVRERMLENVYKWWVEGDRGRTRQAVRAN